MSAAHPRPPLVDALRAATSPLHARLDRHPALRGLAGPEPTVAGVGEALARLYGPIAALEGRAAAGLAALGVPYPFAPRAPGLAADLALLGLLPVPHAGAAPRATGIGGLAGRLYVLEGARLGATVLARRVPPSPAPTGAWRFFAEADAAASWARFMALAAGLDGPVAAEDGPAVRVAQAAFGCLLDHLDALGAARPA